MHGVTGAPCQRGVGLSNPWDASRLEWCKRALVVSIPKGNLTVLCLQFNLQVQLRKPGQPSLRLYIAL
jgi:hypothetical protein